MGRRREGGLSRAIATEAARLLAEGHCQDSHSACRKAAERLGESNPRHWPDQAAIEAALREYQGLFLADRQPAALARLRRLALQAMHDLAAFRPRLTGAVAKGLADSHSPVRLLLSADTPELVAMALLERRIPYREAEVMLSFGGGRREARPAFRFQAGDTTMELVVLAAGRRHDPPRDSADNSPLPALSAADLEALLAAS